MTDARAHREIYTCNAAGWRLMWFVAVADDLTPLILTRAIPPHKPEGVHRRRRCSPPVRCDMRALAGDVTCV